MKEFSLMQQAPRTQQH